MKLQIYWHLEKNMHMHNLKVEVGAKNMNVYDTANRLASEIRSAQEYKMYKEAKDKLNANLELKQKVDEFEKVRYEVQVLAMQGKTVEEEKNKKLQEMYVMLIEHQEIKEYFDLEVKFNVMLTDINKIDRKSVV